MNERLVVDRGPAARRLASIREICRLFFIQNPPSYQRIEPGQVRALMRAWERGQSAGLATSSRFPSGSRK